MLLIETLRTKKINLNQIISVVILVVAGFVSITIYQKQNKKIDQIRQIQSEQEKKNEILFRIEGLKKRVELYKQAFQAKDNREIINTITNLATATRGVEIVSIKPQKMSAGREGIGSKIYNKSFFQLIVRVDGYHQLGEFISRLESSPTMFIIELLQVTNIQVAGVGRTAAQPEKLQVGLIISVVFF